MNIRDKNQFIVGLLLIYTATCLYWFTIDVEFPLRILPVTGYWITNVYGIHKIITNIRKKGVINEH